MEKGIISGSVVYGILGKGSTKVVPHCGLERQKAVSDYLWADTSTAFLLCEAVIRVNVYEYHEILQLYHNCYISLRVLPSLVSHVYMFV